MQINLEMPDDVACHLGENSMHQARAALETVALEGVRSGKLSASQARRLLGFRNRLQIDGFLKDHGVYLPLTAEEVEQDAATARECGQLSGVPGQARRLPNSSANISLKSVTGSSYLLYFEKKGVPSMTVTLDLSPEKEEAFKAKAEAQGLSLQQWLIQIAEQHVLPAALESDLQDTDPKEWARRFHAWTQSQSRATSLLPDEALSRESIYPDWN